METRLRLTLVLIALALFAYLTVLRVSSKQMMLGDTWLSIRVLLAAARAGGAGGAGGAVAVAVAVAVLVKADREEGERRFEGAEDGTSPVLWLLQLLLLQKKK
jgi:hypothetical protein